MLSLLIVDDERLMVGELEEALTDFGYTVHTALSAAAATETLNAHPEIGVMISDIRMPECDGIELTRRTLAGRTEHTALEVVLITGHATLDDAVSAIRNGAFDFVRKPFRLKDIFEATTRAMARAIGRRKLAASLARAAAPNPSAASMPLAAVNLENLLREVQAPLVPILGYAEMLGHQQADVGQSAQEIRLGAQRLVAAMDDLRTLSLIDGGALMLNKSLVPASNLILDAAAACAAAANARGVQLLTPPAPEVMLHVDPTHFPRALDALLRIAIELAPRSGAVLLGAEESAEGVMIMFDAHLPGQAAATVDQLEDAAEPAARVLPLSMMLATKLVHLHDGTIDLAWSEHRAFQATLAFHLAA